MKESIRLHLFVRFMFVFKKYTRNLRIKENLLRFMYGLIRPREQECPKTSHIFGNVRFGKFLVGRALEM